MEEKYFIINSANQFYIVLKCTRQKLENYMYYGSKLVINDNGSLNLIKLSDWLINHSIRFRAEILPIKNRIIKSVINRHVNFLNDQSQKAHMFIPDEKMEELISSMENGNDDMCWNFDNTIQ